MPAPRGKYFHGACTIVDAHDALKASAGICSYFIMEKKPYDMICSRFFVCVIINSHLSCGVDWWCFTEKVLSCGVVFQSSSSLANCSAIEDVGSATLPLAFIHTLSIPDLNIIYWHPSVCGNINTTNYENFSICVKWVGFPYAISLFCGLLTYQTWI